MMQPLQAGHAFRLCCMRLAAASCLELKLHSVISCRFHVLWGGRASSDAPPCACMLLVHVADKQQQGSPDQARGTPCHSLHRSKG
jgi:hypothetical protein